MKSHHTAGDPGLIPGSGRSPGEGKGYPLLYSWVSLVAQLVKSHLHCRRPQFDPWVRKVPWRRVGSPPQCSRFPGSSPGVDDADGNPRISLTVTGKARLLSWLPSATVLRVTCWDVGDTFMVQAASGPKGWGISFPRL